MSRRSLGTLTLDLVAKTGNFEAGLDRAGRMAERRNRAMRGSFQEVRDSARESAGGVDAFSSSLDNTDQRVKRAIAGLGRLALTTAGITSAMAVIDRADNWGEMASRIRMATDSQEDFELVMRRTAESARETYRSLDESRELFIRTTSAIQGLGYSLEQSMDLTDSFSLLLVTNAASAQRGASAINAYSRAIQTGRVDSNAWQSILQAIPSVIDQIAESSGRTADEVRNLGITGRLSVSELNAALLNGLEDNRRAAAAMPTTVRDAFQNISNSIQEYIGWQNDATGATATLANSISLLGDNFDVVANAILFGTTAGLTRYVAGIGASTIATIQDTSEKRRAAAHEIGLARAQAATTSATLAKISALSSASRSHAQVAAATAAHETALRRLTAAQVAHTSVSQAALGILGGPVGLTVTVGLAAAAFFTFRNTADDVSRSLEGLHAQIASARDTFHGLSQAAAATRIDEVGDALRDTEEEAGILAARMESLQRLINEAPSGARAEEWNRELRAAAATYETLSERANAYRRDLEVLQGVLGGVAPGPAEASEAFQRLEAQINERIALFGREGDAERLRYQIAVGTLSDISEAEAEALIPLYERYEALQANARAENERASHARAASDREERERQAIKDRVAALKEQAAILGMSAAEVEAYRLAMAGATNDQLKNAAAALDQVRAFEERNKLIEDAASVFQSLQTQEEQIQASYDRRRDIILRAAEDEIATAEETKEALLRLEEDYNQRMLEANVRGYWARWLEGAENAFTDFDRMAADTAENFSRGFGSAFERMIFDSESAGDAARGMIEGVARSTVNALGQMAGQWLAYEAVQLLVGRTTQASAAAGLTANAQAGVFQAGINAFSSTAAIPIVGPAMAPAAMAAAIGATQPLATAVSATALAGMAHDGIDFVPREGTWLLDKGERVLGADLNRDLSDYLRRGGASGVAPPNIYIDARGASNPREIEEAARRGAEEGYRLVLEDVSSNGPIRQELGS